ncbi:hypothetical protein Hbl1158_10350 [Halobaculum sp. CBA1158]|uniref:hypothetical protein n=1 Tax=Halobaculum sp. CBA1158 TaxID=2904243 RepID=UPI001F1F1EE2|nr:hypothetical protein [Halobaculum sp. CBA1158]UIO98935.1 hypothetical protein Hbl1158_10350 [Halobaculum sp. CBA1158]
MSVDRGRSSREYEEGTIGIWIGEDDLDMLREFDHRFSEGDGRSRSKAIKRAMRLLITLDSTLDRVAWSFDDERGLLAWARQAFDDAIEREESGE